MLSEWHLTPEWINEHWTDEELALMVQARGERLRQVEQPTFEKPLSKPPSKLLTDAELFKRMNIKVTKR